MKLPKNNNFFIKTVFFACIFLLVFYFLNIMFEKTSKIEGFYGVCPESQYLNQEFNKCCSMQKWYSPSKNTCVVQHEGACPKGQYINDKYNKCCSKDKYYHYGVKKCVNMK